MVRREYAHAAAVHILCYMEKAEAGKDICAEAVKKPSMISQIHLWQKLTSQKNGKHSLSVP